MKIYQIGIWHIKYLDLYSINVPAGWLAYKQTNGQRDRWRAIDHGPLWYPSAQWSWGLQNMIVRINYIWDALFWCTHHWCSNSHEQSYIMLMKYRNHSGYGLSQREEVSLCNTFSHWLIPYPEWSLRWCNMSTSEYDLKIIAYHTIDTHIDWTPDTIFSVCLNLFLQKQSWSHWLRF